MSDQGLNRRQFKDLVEKHSLEFAEKMMNPQFVTELMDFSFVINESVVGSKRYYAKYLDI